MMIMRYKGRNVFLFGMGINFFSYTERLDQSLSVIGFVDSNPANWGKSPFGDGRIVIRPEEMLNYDKPLAVIIPITKKAIDEISRKCISLGIEYSLAQKILNEISIDEYVVQWPERIQKGRVHRFIDLQLRDTTTCNFHCDYCYVWRRDGYKEGRKTSDLSPQQIRKALSLSRCGGACFINICASGETMLSYDIVPLVFELLAEGHYVSLVTNGTITKRIKEILAFDKQYIERMFFKLSYHHLELRKAHLEDTFWKNVRLIAESPCSYTIEITPSDRLISYIPEIKAIFKEKANGAMPHISFARDSTKEDYDLLSDLTIEEYEKTWGQFDSKMFALKKNLYNRQITQYCYAGNWTFNVSLQNGNMQPCYRQKDFYSILSNPNSSIPIATVGHECAMKYCFNGHAFIAWGAVPEIDCDFYLDMRDRADNEGNHWIKPQYARAMRQKLYENNFQYHNCWPDYERLFAKQRRPALILFNSPDYSNLGDHAIAMGEEKFFRKYFSNSELIQVSCEEYVLENLKIKNVIRKDDVILISGGGYLGTLWPRFDDIVRHIVSSYPDNQCFVLPQTLFYEDSSFGRQEASREAKCFQSHGNMHLALREQRSYNLAKEIFSFGSRISLVPDMALMLRYDKQKTRKGVLLCFRKDKEAIHSYQREAVGVAERRSLNWKEMDTVQEYDVNMVARHDEVEKLMDVISSAEIVFTDRLHAMILSAITGTPCLAFDNISHKLMGSYMWLKRFRYIKMHQEGVDVDEETSALLSTLEFSCDWSDIDSQFRLYADYIKNEIGDGL